MWLDNVLVFICFFPYWSRVCCEPGALLGPFVYRISFNPPGNLGLTSNILSSALGLCLWLFRAQSSCFRILVMLSFCLAGNKTNEPWYFHVPKWALESTDFPRLGNAKAGTMRFESCLLISARNTLGCWFHDCLDTGSVSSSLFLVWYFTHDKNSNHVLWRKIFDLFLLCDL